MKILNVKNGNRTLKNHVYVDGRSVCRRVHISDKHTVTGEAETVECKCCAEKYAEYNKRQARAAIMLQVQNMVKSTEPTDVELVTKSNQFGDTVCIFRHKNVLIQIFVEWPSLWTNDDFITTIHCRLIVDDKRVYLPTGLGMMNVKWPRNKTHLYIKSLMHYMIRTYTDYTETAAVETETVEAENVETETAAVETETAAVETETETETVETETAAYEIVNGSHRLRWSQICTPEKSVWVYNACSTIEWQIQMRLDSTNHHGVPHYIHGSIRKAIMPKLTYTLNIITQTKTVEPIQHMYFDSVEAAFEHAQTFIQQVLGN